MSITIDIGNVLTSYVLKQNERYHLYLKKDDGYNAFGYVGAYKDTANVEMLVSDNINSPDVFGVWVTIESDDGDTDFTVFHIERRIKHG